VCRRSPFAQSPAKHLVPANHLSRPYTSRVQSFRDHRSQIKYQPQHRSAIELFLSELQKAGAMLELHERWLLTTAHRAS
jgi:hypothetical protein